MKNATLLILLAIILMMTADCIVSYPRFGPPPLRSEALIGNPGPGYTWINGYWGWSGGNYAWHRGYWARVRPGRAWVSGRWELRGNRWVWYNGYWR